MSEVLYQLGNELACQMLERGYPTRGYNVRVEGDGGLIAFEGPAGKCANVAVSGRMLRTLATARELRVRSLYETSCAIVDQWMSGRSWVEIAIRQTVEELPKPSPMAAVEQLVLGMLAQRGLGTASVSAYVDGDGVTFSIQWGGKSFSRKVVMRLLEGGGAEAINAMNGVLDDATDVLMGRPDRAARERAAAMNRTPWSAPQRTAGEILREVEDRERRERERRLEQERRATLAANLVTQAANPPPAPPPQILKEDPRDDAEIRASLLDLEPAKAAPAAADDGGDVAARASLLELD